jgi:hypothetical protein
VVTPDENSRIIQPDRLAELLGVDATQEQQRAVDTLIDEAILRYGPLAILKPDPDKGGSFVGALNEYSLAEIMKFPLQGHLVVDRSNGRFFAFDDRSGIFTQITKEETGKKLSRIYARLPELSKKLEPLSARPASVRGMKNLLEALAGTVGENYPFGGDPDQRPSVIHKPVANGLLSFDLESDESPAFRAGLFPSDRALHRAPVIYDPAAGAVPERLINELLVPALGNKEMSGEFLDDFATAWLGGGLWPFCFILIGAADSGKSQLVEMLRLLHGQPHWVALSARNVGDKFGSSFLAGPVRVVSFTDAKGNALTGEVGELVKGLTGGDFKEDRGPHAQLLVAIKGDKIFLLTSNSCPKVDLDDDSAAWERRIRAYRFHSYPVEKRIADFAQVLLRAEGSALLNRLIEGARRRIRLRLDGKRPAMLPQMRELLDEILRRSCPIASFCEPRLTPERGHQINRAELYSMFCDWLRERNGRPWNREDFNKRAAEVLKRAFGASLSNSVEGGGKGWRGVRWLSHEEQADAD